MKQYKDIQITRKEFVSTTCDKCGKIENDIIKFQEWLYIHFIGGYNSIFEDGGEYECDLCQECFKELLGKYLRYLGNTIGLDELIKD